MASGFTGTGKIFLTGMARAIPIFRIERKIVIIQITRAERDKIREKYPDVHIVRTMRQHSTRGKYYCVETRGVMDLLVELRGWPNRSRRNRR